MPPDSDIKAELIVLIDKFEKNIIIPIHRSCDKNKIGCEKLDDGTLTFPNVLSHYAQHSDDYLVMSSAWLEIERWIKDAVWKFNEDQRRMDEAMEDNKLEKKN